MSINENARNSKLNQLKKLFRNKLRTIIKKKIIADVISETLELGNFVRKKPRESMNIGNILKRSSSDSVNSERKKRC